MTTSPATLEATHSHRSAPAPGETPRGARRLEAWWHAIDHKLTEWGDYLNPILVKETRQALKSKQFTFTFLLVLLVSWVITIGTVAYIGPGIAYAAAGGYVLVFYCYLLAFPLAVIVPFGAFRSLAAEREENTYDLLRVSTLSPRQIVNGKLGSTLVQIGVYVSVLAPCLAFTYLLRGIDVVTIMVVLAYIVLGSIGLSTIGLLAAAAAPHKQGQVVLSVGFVTLLLGCFLGGMGILAELMFESRFVRDHDFVPNNLLLLSIFATTWMLAYLAAVALTAPRTVNRSTPLRWGMLLQQAVFYGWCAYVILFREQLFYNMLLAMFFVLSAYWYVMGTLLSSESPDLSHRVQRQLPQSTLGRWLLGWLSPGPGTGYMFALIHVTTAGLVIAAVALADSWNWLGNRGIFGIPPDTFGDIWPAMIATWCYVAIYLGLGKLLVDLLRRVTTVGALAAFLLHVILVMLGAGVPYGLQMSIPSWRDMGFTSLQWPNPFWGIADTVASPFDAELFMFLSVLVAAALCVLLFNMPSVAREVVRGRIALPTRVAEEEAQLNQPKPVPQSPWDDGQAPDEP